MDCKKRAKQGGKLSILFMPESVIITFYCHYVPFVTFWSLHQSALQTFGWTESLEPLGSAAFPVQPHG